MVAGNTFGQPLCHPPRQGITAQHLPYVDPLFAQHCLGWERILPLETKDRQIKQDNEGQSVNLHTADHYILLLMSQAWEEGTREDLWTQAFSNFHGLLQQQSHTRAKMICVSKSLLSPASPRLQALNSGKKIS